MGIRCPIEYIVLGHKYSKKRQVSKKKSHLACKPHALWLDRNYKNLMSLLYKDEWLYKPKFLYQEESLVGHILFAIGFLNHLESNL